MPPSDGRRPPAPDGGGGAPANPTTDEFIEQLVGGISGTAGAAGYDDDPRLAQVEERLTQLRDLPEDEAEAGDAEVADDAPPVAVPPVQPPQPAAARRAAAKRPTADEIVIAAAHAAGTEPVYAARRPPAARRGRKRRRGSPLPFYLAVLLLLLAGALFVLWKPAATKVAALSSALQAIEVASASACEPASLQDDDPIETLTADRQPVPAPVRPAPLMPPLAVAQDMSASPPAILYLNQRLVKTYQVGADGRIVFETTN